MKITFVTHNYAPFTGGIETHAEQVAHALSARHEVTVAALNFRRFQVPRRLGPLDQNLLAQRTGEDRRDGPVRVLSLGPRWPERLKMLPMLLRCTPVLPRWFHPEFDALTHPFHAWAFTPGLTRAIRGADVVHSLATFDLGWTTGAVARRLGVPLVCTPFAHPGAWGDGPNDIAFYKRCDAVIGLLGSDRDHLARLGVAPEKLHTIGVSPATLPPVDPAGFRRQAGCVGSEPLILFVGRMTAYKGATAVLAAAPLIWERFPDARFVFIGPGSADETAIFDGADPRIRYLGRVEDQTKADALAGCDVFAMPSVSEILPTVYLEAWSFGKPVVGGTAHGVPALVEGNRAGITAGQTAGSVADAVCRLLGNPALARELGENGRRLVENQYSVAAVAGALERLYEEVVHSGCSHGAPSPCPVGIAADTATERRGYSRILL